MGRLSFTDSSLWQLSAHLAFVVFLSPKEPARESKAASPRKSVFAIGSISKQARERHRTIIQATLVSERTSK